LSDEKREAYAKACAMPDDTKHEIRTQEAALLDHQHERPLPGPPRRYSMLKNLYRESWLAGSNRC
jgi:hypothetical protein